jgi:peptidoglycan/xylan/chitin deacetylase (PgdA/CDA1 family)
LLPTKHKKVALSFDDGPNPVITPKILRVLKHYRVKAAFFVCGANAVRYPHLVREIDVEGHIVGNHTFSHSLFLTLVGLALNETLITQEILKDILGKDKRFFRPPHGLASPFLLRRLRKLGFRIVPFDVVANDWKRSATAEKIIKRVKNSVRDGSIIVLHDGDETKETADRFEVVKALPTIIETLSVSGFEFVGVDQILKNRIEGDILSNF